MPLNDISGFNSLIANDFTLNNESNEIVYFDFAFYLQKHYSFRFSEISVIFKEQLLFDFNICFKISKSHQLFLIRDEFAWNFLFNYFAAHNTNAFVIRYKAYLYYIKRFHPDIISKTTKKNYHITHAMRYINANKFKNSFPDSEITQTILHHKSKSASKYYLSKKNSQNIN